MQLRLMLHKVVTGLHQSGDDAAIKEFERLLWIVQLTAAKALAQARHNAEAVRKVAVSLLRYIREIPADKAFYEAGMACKVPRRGMNSSQSEPSPQTASPAPVPDPTAPTPALSHAWAGRIPHQP